MNSIFRCILNVAIGALVIGISASTAVADPGPTPTTREVLRQVDEIKSEQRSLKRDQDADELVVMVQRQDLMLVKSAEVEALIDLLGDGDDSIKGGGSFGQPRTDGQECRARTERCPTECVRADLTSAPAIRAALIRMGVAPPASSCPH